MAPKEPNRHQLSSKLSYSQDTPLFLQKLKNRIAGIPDEDEDEDPEFEDDGSGRPPIPRRPAIPTRPDDDPGSEQEDDADEKPQVVVLREGKHLTEREAENVRRKERGLPPLPETKEAAAVPPEGGESSSKKQAAKVQTPSLSFSSSKGNQKSVGKKRKAISDFDDLKDDIETKKAPTKKKKAQKNNKTLLSFGDDA